MPRIVFTLEDGTEIETELDSDLITIGRHPESMVVLPSSSVSSHHATIKRKDGEFYVQDLGTTNGTKLNGAEVEEAKLAHGDHLMFGDIPAALFLIEAPVAKAITPVAEVANAAAPALPLPLAASSVVRPRPAARPLPQYKESSGCAGFFMLLVFLSFAFLIGLCLRHYNETQGFLPIDLLSKARGNSESDAAPEKPAAPEAKPAAKPAAKAAKAEKKEPAPDMSMGGAEPSMAK